MSPDRPVTQIETDEEVSAALHAAYAAPMPQTSARPTAPAANPVSPWRPTRRPPTPTLIVCDDGRTDGEAITLRAARFVIGRTEGDLTLPHDEMASTRHAEITRQQTGGLWRWVVTDLQSTNGLFVRVTRTALADRAELLVGGGRYRFDAPDAEPAATVDHVPDPAKPPNSTRGWAADAPFGLRPPALTELTPGGIGNRVVLTRPEYWIGTDPGCAICRPDDPFCEPRQCRVYRGPKGGWHAEHPKTLNGLWFRVPQIVVERTVQFQVGEQRFRLRV
ncbi:MAG: FHA domain-containing protein [Gemmataceae bacterium]|nr:FHA domain-containing protein [Gemmataceae bacterium]